jgi:acyl carrier protein
MAALRSILEEILYESGKPVPCGMSRGSRLREDLGLNSLELAILTVRLEATYQVDVFEQGLVATVGEVIERIRENRLELTEEELIS